MNRKEENERMAIMETKLDSVFHLIKDIKISVDKTDETLDEHIKLDQIYHEGMIKSNAKDYLKIISKIDKLEQKLDNKYSAKWVEWAVKGLFGTITTGGVSILVYLLVH